MANFEVYGKCEINRGDVTVETVSRSLKASLAKYYDEGDIAVTPMGIKVDGNLKAFWERAITTADVQFNITGNQLSYRVNGTSSLGAWPWVWFVLGFFTGFFFIWFLSNLIEYLVCRDRPKQYFEEAFKAAQFEIETAASPTGGMSSDAQITSLEKLAALKERGLLTDEEFNRKKYELLRA